MMRILLRMSVAALLAAPAAAQQPEASGIAGDADPGLVVTGRTEAEREAEAAAFVRAVSPPSVDGQFARWHDPLCPAAVGLAPSVAARVVDRVRRAASDAGAPLAREGCAVNAQIVFTADAGALLRGIERRRPRLLAGLSPADARALRASEAPVRWWTDTRSEGADGNPFASMPPVAFGLIAAAGPTIPATERTRFGDSYRSSNLSTAMRVAVTGAVVLVDVPRTTGHSLDAVTDYAAFVILARVRSVPPAGTAATILSLFAADPAGRPAALTGADRAYLVGLYAAPADRPVRAQRRAIAGAVARQR